MPVTTVSAALHITPTVIKTFFKHGKRKAKKFKDGRQEDDAQDDIFFDEAFHIVKAFIEMGTKNTVESLQGFTNTHVPAPYWAAVSPVCVPLSSCNRAADFLIDWFGPEELKHVVGGERWWQVRGLDGVDGEWITEKQYLSDEKVDVDIGRKLTDDEEDILRMEKIETVMLYVHGGGYFWGSINTHRFQIIRYARKIKGRAFAVNYRKAPQYPWPCPLQDVIAAYLYLIQPPLNALHKPISASKIVFAGDSAGGGLCLTVLTVLRDLGLPMPAGAVLISPWVDLTHSFPSVMDNTHSDIIPQHGFLAKPSTLWPVHPLPQEDGRVVPAMSNSPSKPGHTDTLRPSKARLQEVEKSEGTVGKVQSQPEMLQVNMPDAIETSAGEEKGNSGHSSSGSCRFAVSGEDAYDVDFWEPKPPKVLMDDPEAVPLELRSQIQLYATTEQLTHPLVSPVLQGSLGNLPPLYILAGDGEVLRDEIIYVAHRAAHPGEFPTRHGILRDGRRQKENAEKYRTPTKVHLQVFDGMCHVLTVFSFTNSAKYAYRSIAEFVKHVTNCDKNHLERNPFPELHRPPSEISTDSEAEEGRRHRKKSKAKTTVKVVKPQLKTESSETDMVASGVRLYKDNENVVAQEVKNQGTESMPLSMSISESSLSLVNGKEQKDVPNIIMIRERVDIRGRTRPMESKGEISALKLRPAQVGLMKEAPTIRWLKGQEEWDKAYKRSAEKAIKKRQTIEAKAKRLIDNARDQGLVLTADGPTHNIQWRGPNAPVGSESESATDGTIQEDRRWGPLDLDDERPPPTAIAKRRDTPEALALLKKSIYHTAPVTHQTVPRLKTADAIRAAFDPNDDPVKPPKQSVSEQQVYTHVIPIHGLRMWDELVGYFMRKSLRKAANGTKQATAISKNIGVHMPVGILKPSEVEER